jgi:hypothetical protein
LFVSFKLQAWEMNKEWEEEPARLRAHQCISEYSTCMCIHESELHGKHANKQRIEQTNKLHSCVSKKQTNKQTNTQTVISLVTEPFLHSYWGLWSPQMFPCPWECLCVDICLVNDSFWVLVCKSDVVTLWVLSCGSPEFQVSTHSCECTLTSNLTRSMFALATVCTTAAGHWHWSAIPWPGAATHRDK